MYLCACVLYKFVPLYKNPDSARAGQYSVKGTKEMAVLALQCISLNPKDRPRITAVVESLESLQQYKDMAVTCGKWAASPKPGRNNGVSTKVRIESRGGNLRKASPVTPTRKKT